MKNLRNKFLMLGLFVMQGCVIQSDQLSTLINLANAPDAGLSQNSWVVKFKDYQSIVYAVDVSEGTLFSNSAGDQVLFDGWMIRKISGLGRRGLAIKIDEAVGVRTFKQGRRTIANHICQNWQRYISNNMVSLSQSCSDIRKYTNSILILEDGSISVIRQIVDDRYTPLTITKVE